jgi:hypothetical protein
MRIVATLVLGLALVGCGDDSPGTTDMAIPVPTNFDSIKREVLQPSCTFSVCHSAEGQSKAGHLDLMTNPYSALVGVAADNAKAHGQGLLRVSPCDADHSFLVIKLSLTKDLDPMTDFGHHMPDTNPSLDPTVIAAIKDWINRGALANEADGVTGSTCLLHDMSPSTD